MTQMFRILCSALLLTLTGLPVIAHEFWIHPRKFEIAAGAKIRADFRNGETFQGMQRPFLSRDNAGLFVKTPAGIQSLSPRDGDRPAIDLTASQPGLYVLAHETTFSRLTYTDWAKWQKFVAHKDLGAVAARHAERGLPQKNFKEGYSRHAKALVGVGSGAGSDAPMGLATEFVAASNPYAAGYDGIFDARLIYGGKPRANAQVEIFDRAPGGKVRVSLARTDGSGRIRMRTQPGHTYLLDAVVLREPASGDRLVVWETLWASMTFKHPER